MDVVIPGAAFGAALTAAGIYAPQTILSQMELGDWSMIQAFLTATASTAAIIHGAQSLGSARLPPRGASSLGLAGRYDGNVVGGALLGIGMTISAACPGTVLVQVALGQCSGYYVAAGGVVAGLTYTRLVRPTLAQRQQHQRQKASADSTTTTTTTALTIQDSLGLSKTTVLTALEVICAAAVATTLSLSGAAPHSRYQPIIGGLLISLAQAISLATRGSLIGVSGAFEEAGDWLWWALTGGRKKDGAERPKTSSMLFALAFLAGARAITLLDHSLAHAPSISVSPVKAAAGGFLSILGSRIAGGCTSGHGISGISLLSVSSVVTIGTAFAAGAVVAAIQ